VMRAHERLVMCLPDATGKALGLPIAGRDL